MAFIKEKKSIFYLLSFCLLHATLQAQSSLIISEIMANPNAVTDANGEWFELYNPTDEAVDLRNWTLSDNNASLRTITSDTALLVPAKGYFVLGLNTDLNTNGGIPVAYDYGSSSTFALTNTADAIILKDSNGATVDSVAWDDNWTIEAGSSLSLKSPELDNSDVANWCVSSTAIGSGDFGTPGTENDCNMVTGLPSKGIVPARVFPNPGTGVFHLQLSPGETLLKTTVYNITGTLILASDTGETLLNLSYAETGIFFLYLELESGVRVIKVIKK